MNGDEMLSRFEREMEKRPLARKTRLKYLEWAVRYVKWCRDVKPKGDKEAVVAEFLSTLSARSVSHQKGALNALAAKNGFYACLGKPVGRLPEWVNAKRPRRMPVWVTVEEAEAIMRQLRDPWKLMVALQFGSGLRVGEVTSLRWRDIDLERRTITVRSGKGDKDRVTVLSQRVIEVLRERRERCLALWREDRATARPGVEVPDALRFKYPKAGEEWPFYWVFPAAGESRDPESGIVRRHHVHEKSFSRPLRDAVRRAGIAKRVSSHAFRHGFATLYLLRGGTLDELRERLGHADVQTTMIYTHCLAAYGDRIGSPWDEPGMAGGACGAVAGVEFGKLRIA